MFGWNVRQRFPEGHLPDDSTVNVQDLKGAVLSPDSGRASSSEELGVPTRVVARIQAGGEMHPIEPVPSSGCIDHWT